MRNDELRIAVRNLRRGDESFRDLVERIADDDRMLARIADMCPSVNYNTSMIKRVILSDSFVESLYN